MTFLCDWNSRSSVKKTESWCFWIGIGFFFVCAVSGIFGTQIQACNYVSAGSFIVGLLLEVLSRKCDNRYDILCEQESAGKDATHDVEIKKIILKAENTTRIAVDLAIKQADRHITDADKDVLKNRLGRFNPQKFQIMQVGFGDTEGITFANEICAALKEIGWTGKVHPWCEQNIFSLRIHSGVSVNFGEADDGCSTGIIRKSSEYPYVALEYAFMEMGIKWAEMYTRDHNQIPIGTIEIIVGPKA
jgi:hypothetical protein